MDTFRSTLPLNVEQIDATVPPMEARSELCVVMAAALVGCPKSTERPTLDVAVSGCRSVLGDGTCEWSPDTPITTWTPSSFKKDTKFAGAQVVKSEVAARGTRIVLRPDEGVQSIVLEADEGTWRIPVRQSKLTSEETSWDDKTIDEKLPTLAGRAKARALHQKGRLSFRAGRGAEASRFLEQAAAEASGAAVYSQRARSDLLRVFILTYAVRDFSRARKIIESIPQQSRDGQAQALRAYHAGLLEMEVGDYRRALGRFEDAKLTVDRLGLSGLSWIVEMQSAMTLLALGRTKDAVSRLEKLRTARYEELPACGQADLLTNASWARLRGGSSSKQIATDLEKALSLYQSDCKTVPASKQGNVLVNLGLHALQSRDFPSARGWLEKASKLPDQPDITQWRRALEAEIELGMNRADRALAQFESLEKWASEAEIGRLVWRAKVGQGRALEKLSRPQDAVRKYREAEALLDDQSGRVPVDRGRLHFFGDRDESARRLADLLVRSGDKQGAFEAIRRSSRRVIAGVGASEAVNRLDAAARTRWEAAFAQYKNAREALDAATANAWAVPKEERQAAKKDRERKRAALRKALDETLAVLALGAQSTGALRPPKAGEVMLTAAPVEGGWLGLAGREKTVEVARFARKPNRQEWADAFAATFRAATSITVLPGAQTTGVAFQNLPFEGGPLVQKRAVTFSLDIRVPSEAKSEEKRALVIGDTRGDLSGARAEMKRVGTLLTKSGWAVARLEGVQETPENARQKIRNSDLLHYAGHGTFGGTEGWQSGLVFGDTALDIGDVLTLESTPTWVVLSGCETAKQPSVDTAAGFGIAQAFIRGGSRWVIAAPEPVKDDVALAMSTQLYSSLSAGADFASAYREAMIVASKKGTPPAFMLIGP